MLQKQSTTCLFNAVVPRLCVVVSSVALGPREHLGMTWIDGSRAGSKSDGTIKALGGYGREYNMLYAGEFGWKEMLELFKKRKEILRR